MALRKLLLAGAIAASLAGAGLFGALVGSPSASSAEEAATTDEPTDPAATDENGNRPPAPGERGDRGDRGDRGSGGPAGPDGPGGPASLEIAAETLGITEDELRTELEAGGSITSVAQAEGVELQTVTDALIADATAQIAGRVDAGDLTAEQAAERTAEVPDRIAEFVAREGLPARGNC